MVAVFEKAIKATIMPPRAGKGDQTLTYEKDIDES